MEADDAGALTRRRLLAAAALAGAWPPAAAAPADEAPLTGRWVPAYAAFGRPALAPGFTHFPYVDPDAPKRGTMFLPNPDQRTSFDKFNYFTLRGNAPAGVLHYMHETLAVRGADEPMTMYGLLAQEMLVADDRSAVSFRLHPAARFSDGSPVLAEDILYTFQCLSGPKADPQWQAFMAGVARALVLDERTLRFELKEPSNDAVFKVGTLMPVFSRRWAPGKAFDEIVTEYPLTSGPYTIARADSGRRLEFRRNPDYWARDLAVRRGFFNFDRVVYRFYQDEDVSLEAFKAGEFDIMQAYGAGTFVRRQRGPKWDDGRIVKARWPAGAGRSLQSYHFNLRRPLFQDIRVRRAITLTYDFEDINRYHLYERAQSVFNNSEFAAAGLPSAGELALLEPWRAELPPEVFGPAYQAPRAGGALAYRRNLLEARGLLEAAGWKLDPQGVLRNAKGERFEFEYLTGSGSSVTQQIWRQGLEKLGIRMNIRVVDFALYTTRIQSFDFDLTLIVEGADFTLPAASDYKTLYGSKAADEKGSNNTRGVKSAVADHVLAAMEGAASLAQLRDACRALDRIVMWSCWQVPELYSSTINCSYWNKFGLPDKRPRFFTMDVTIDLDPQIAWPQLTWWAKA